MKRAAGDKFEWSSANVFNGAEVLAYPTSSHRRAKQ